MIVVFMVMSALSVTLYGGVEPDPSLMATTELSTTTVISDQLVVPPLPTLPDLASSVVSDTSIPVTITTSTALTGSEYPQEVEERLEEAPTTSTQETGTQLQWRRPVIVQEGITMAPEDRRGNWYDKRQILSQARTVYEQIRALIAKIDGQQQGFVNRQRSLNKQIVALYKELGFEQGKIDETFTNLMTDLEQERTVTGQLNEEERKLLAEVEEKKKLLQELRDDTGMLTELEGAVDKAVATMLEQLELCRSYEQKAWENYDKIDNVLNEKIAQQLYLEMQSYAEHIAAIDAYLRGALTQYIERTAQSIRTYMQKIQRDVDDLQQRGIILSAKVAAEQKAAAEERQREEERKKNEQIPVPPAKELSWWQKISASLGTILQGIGNRFLYALTAIRDMVSKEEKMTSVLATKDAEVDVLVAKTGQ